MCTSEWDRSGRTKVTTPEIFFFSGRHDLLTLLCVCVLGKGGLCYRIKTNTLDRDIIMQVVTTDSGDGNVHLMSADGGAVCISRGF